MNRCLRIHGDAEIDEFSPLNAFRRDVVGWVADALGRGDIVYESDFCGGDGGNWRTDTLWQATPALRDAYLSHVGFGGEYEEHLHAFVYSCFLHFVAHARISTICSVGLLVRYSNLSPSLLAYEINKERTAYAKLQAPIIGINCSFVLA